MARIFAVFALLVLLGPELPACSVLSHEALVDALWDTRVEPILRQRYPAATAEELKKAHAFSYGGSIIQDLGYYPYGNKKFSDLTHYVQTGRFIHDLLKDANDLNEYAFALGALSHYVSDVDVHRGATNPGEAMLYPKLQRRFGSTITYEDAPAAHLKTEFGFDVLEVAKGRFAPQAYHDFIGFEVANDLLKRAFADAYGLDLGQLFGNYDRVIGSYRRAVSRTIPQATRIAWAQREDDIQQTEPGIRRRRFVYIMSRSSYEKDWGKDYDRPSAWDRFLAVLLKLIPPVGPLKTLQFKMPTPPVEQLFLKSFNDAAVGYGSDLQDCAHNKLQLKDINFDTGEAAAPGTYRLQDEAVVFWLHGLAEKNFASADANTLRFLERYFSGSREKLYAEQEPEVQKQISQDLAALHNASRS